MSGFDDGGPSGGGSGGSGGGLEGGGGSGNREGGGSSSSSSSGGLEGGSSSGSGSSGGGLEGGSSGGSVSSGGMEGGSGSVAGGSDGSGGTGGLEGGGTGGLEGTGPVGGEKGGPAGTNETGYGNVKGFDHTSKTTPDNEINDTNENNENTVNETDKTGSGSKNGKTGYGEVTAFGRHETGKVENITPAKTDTNTVGSKYGDVTAFSRNNNGTKVNNETNNTKNVSETRTNKDTVKPAPDTSKPNPELLPVVASEKAMIPVSETKQETEPGKVNETKQQETDKTNESKQQKETDKAKEVEKINEAKAHELNEITKQRYEESEKQLDETLQRIYKDQPEKYQEMRAFVDRMKETAQPYYDNSTEVAKHTDSLQTYSDHNIAHPNEVTASVAESLSQMKEYEKANDVPEAARVNDKVVLSAAVNHDTGMAGTKENQQTVKDDPDTKLDGNTIRNNHHAESANRILENSDKFDSKEQAIESAWVTYMHSKSKSGVKDLGDSESMVNALNTVKSNYEKANPNGGKLDLSSFGKVNSEGQLTEMTPEVHTRVGNEALMLRVGDAQRPATDTPTTMTGRVMECDKTAYKDTSGFSKPVADEVADKKVEFVDPNDPENKVPDSTDAGALMYTTGERNVDAGTMTYTSNGTLEVSYVVKDAYVDQAATRAVLENRMEEANTAAHNQNAPDGLVTQANIVHVVVIEKGDEQARSALEAALNTGPRFDDKGNEIQQNVRVELKD